MITTLLSLGLSSMLCVSPVFAEDINTVAWYDTYAKVPSLGNYEFEVESHEIPSHEVLPIVGKEYFPYSTMKYTTEVDNTAPSAKYKAMPISKVDVVFALGKLNQSEQLIDYMNNFATALGTASNSIDARVEKVETSKVDMQKAFQWETDVNGSIGSVGFQNNGSIVNIRGNRTNLGKNAIYIERDKQNPNITFSFDYTLEFGDSISAAGVMFNLRRVGNTLESYAIVMPNYLSSLADSTARKVSLVRLQHTLGTNHVQYTPNEYTVISQLSGGRSGSIKLDIRADGADITIQGQTLTFDLPELGSGLGFFAEHYSHCCNSIGNFNLTNMALTMTNVKSLGEVVQDVSWRDGASRVVIYADDEIPEYLLDEQGDKYQTTLTKLMNNNVYLVGLGNDENRQVMNDLITNISTTDEVKGTYFKNTPVNQGLDNACNWIIELIKNLAKPEDWILVNTEVLWDTIYKDQEHDLPFNFGEHDGTQAQPQDTSDVELANAYGIALTHLYKSDKILAEKWRYRHFNNYFDNSTVREGFHSIWLENPVEIFPNPGLYRINYKRKDNPFYDNVSPSYIFDNYRYWSTDYDYKQSSSA